MKVGRDMKWAQTFQFAAICLACGVLVSSCDERTEGTQQVSVSQESLPGFDLTILEGATLIDGTGAPAMLNSSILLRGDKIVGVGRVGEFLGADSATVIDLSGKTIVPGFFDMHAHVRESMLRPMLAFGITTIRNPGSGRSAGIEIRDRLSSGDILGPRMFTAGKIINDSSAFSLTPPSQSKRDIGTGSNFAEVRSADEARSAVRNQATAGFDFVKVYMGITPALLAAVIEEADTQEVRVIGHLKATSWTQAADSGIDVLTHSCSEGPNWELLEPEVRSTFGWGGWGTSLRSWAATVATYDLDGPRWRRLVNSLVSNRVEVNPTLVTMEAHYWADQSDELASEQPTFAPQGFAEAWSGNWESVRNFMNLWELSAEERLQLRTSYQTCLEMVGKMHSAGVLLTTGTDLGGWMTPGVSFHRELQLLSDAGISNVDIIQIATKNGAQALGILDEVGTLEPGKRADIVVLQDDPLSDIQNTQSIVTVFLGGVSYDPSAILQESQHQR